MSQWTRGVSLVSGIVLCAHIFVLSAHAQEADDQTPVLPDPPGRSYATGLKPATQEQQRNFPRVSPYRAFLPKSIDLSKYFPTPGDQGQLGSCTAWATGYAARAYYAVRVEGRQRNNPDNIPSPEFIYNSIKDKEDCSEGSAVDRALDLLKKGVVSESHYPFAHSACAVISPSMVAEAKDFRIDDWHSVNYSTPDDIKGELAKGNPVVVGLWLTKDFQEHRGPGVFSASAQEDKDGHAVALTGYDDQLQAFRLINSWGRGWGDKGYAWISYDSVTRHAREAFAMTVNKPAPLPTPIPDNLATACVGVHESKINGQLTISGFGGSDDEVEKIKKAYANRGASFDLSVRPWPQCEAMQTLDLQMRAHDTPIVETSSPNGHLLKGDTLSIAVTAPNWPAYIYANYIQADGNVVTLSQPSLTPPVPVGRLKRLTFGDGMEGRSKFTVTGPFGHEVVVVLAARSPLFDDPLPNSMTEREYLTRVRKAIIYKPNVGQEDREITAAVVPLETQEKAP